MKNFYTLLATMAILAAYLPDASAQFSNTVVFRRQTVNSTIRSFTSNVVNKVNDYSNKFTSLRTDMTNSLSSTKNTLTSFSSDTVIGSNALLVTDRLESAIASLASNVSVSLSIVSTNFSAVGTCLSAKTLASIDTGILLLTEANNNFTSIISRSTSSFVGTCRSRFSNTANDLVNQLADRTQDCLNNENTQQIRVSSILNNYATMIRRNYEGLNNNVRYCTGLGSTTSRDEVKAEINGCLKSLATVAYPIYEANINQQFVTVQTMLQLQVVSSNNRVKSCINQVTNTYSAMAKAIEPALNVCLSTGQ